MQFIDDIKCAIETLEKGGIILYPTDTIWGIGCDATQEEAVKKIYNLKKRSDSKSMLVLLHSDVLLPSYVDEVPEVAYDLIELADKPLTIIYDNAKNLAPNLLAEDGSVGIRISKEKFTHELIKRFKRPIVSTSANVSGEPSASFFGEISEEVKNGADYIVNYRQDDTQKAKASSIMKLSAGGLFTMIRE